MLAPRLYQKINNKNEIFYLKKVIFIRGEFVWVWFMEYDLIFFIKSDQDVIHGILYFSYPLHKKELFSTTVQIVRESIPRDVNTKNRNEFYKKFWRNILKKSHQNGINIKGIYLEIIRDTSKFPTELFSRK